MRPPDFSYLTDVYFGFGTLAVLPELLAHLGVRRPLVVTDPGVVKLGLLEPLRLKTPVVFDRVEPNPTEASARAGLEAYRAGGCDGLVALGGGSPIDLAKIVALLVHHAPPLEQYAFVKGGFARIGARMPPLVAVPTTAGTGSEVGRAALLTLASGEKLGFLSPHLLPKAAVCDPELTLAMPPLLTAGTGMDALSHCIESYCSPRFNPVAEALALDGLQRGWRWLRVAVGDGRDRPARHEMLLCSLLGGLTFQKGLGAVHALSHPLGALTGKRLHHGTLNALFLPHVLRFNARECEEKLDALALRIGLARGAELPDAVARFNAQLGLPANLRELGLTEGELAPLAEKALRDHCAATNPRPLALEDCRALYRLAWAGS